MTTTGVALTVGIILVTGLIIGGFFLVREQGEQARREEAVRIAKENLEAQSDEDIALTDGEESTESGSGESTSAETAGDTTVERSSELPRTGPADGMIFLVAGVLTYVAASYLQSRRA